ncbi:MAG: S9 family peptidase, partial [Woeseiaceae bacterium]
MPGIRLSLAILALGASTAACSPGEDVTTPAAEAPDSLDAPARYDAEAFFATTSYSLAGGYAWSSDDSRLLATSDESGIFNAYSLAAADGAKAPLTTSTTDSTFAVSWFPDDARIL